MSQTFQPHSIDEAQRWVQARIESQQPFVVRGRSNRFLPKTGHQIEDTLSLANLKQVNFFDPDDMVVGIESGHSVAELQQLLGQKNMVLPVNPWFGNSSVGGLLACNDIGPNRLNMGGLRDCIIGIQYINGRGERVHAGGKVVKNVTGYDLPRMMLGSQGGLGVITAANFKVTPQVVAPHGMFARFSDSSWLLGIAELHASRLPVDWIQALTPAETTSQDWILGVGISGNAERRARLQKELQALFNNRLTTLPEGETRPELGFLPGTARHTGWVEALRAEWKLAPAHLHLMVLLPTRDALRPIRIESLRHENLHAVAHPVGADLHFFLNSTDAEAQREFLREALPLFRNTPAKMVLAHAHAEVSPAELGDFAQPAGYAFTQRLQKHLDPAGVFHAPFYQLSAASAS
jgi:FAD/FMN-containing dehydrogenase